MEQHIRTRSTPVDRERSAWRAGALALRASRFPAFGSVVAVASRTGRSHPRRGAELSIVTLFDGEIGDPVTWIADGFAPSRLHRSPGAAFAKVAEDIYAHLGSGPIVVHDAPEVLRLLGRILPHWQPTMVFDMRALSRQFAVTSTHRSALVGRSKRSLAALSRRSGSADQAMAAAHQFMRIANGWR